MTATMMGPGDVAVIISNTGRTRSILNVARIARESGAQVIGITGSQLIVETLDNTDIYTPTISRIAAPVIIDILSTAVALGREDDRLARFQLMKRRLSDLRTADQT